MPRKLTLEEFKARIEHKKDEFYLIDETYVNTSTKCTFVDTLYGEWQTTPNKILLGRSHPKRRQEKIRANCEARHGMSYEEHLRVVNAKRESTMTHKYGVKAYTQTPEYLEKTKQTNLAKYGVEHVLQSGDVRQKGYVTNQHRYGATHYTQTTQYQEFKKRTCLEKYGAEYAQQAAVVKEKIAQTNLEKYGARSSLSAVEVREKIRTTNIRKYGDAIPSKTEAVKQKTKITNMQRYGFASHQQSPERKKEVTKHFVNAEVSLKDFAQQNDVDYTTLLQNVKKTGSVEFAIRITPKKNARASSLEKFASEAFEIERYDKKALEHADYRPDFKITDSLFVDVDGLYWHSELNLDRGYHFEKRLAYEGEGRRVLQFREDEVYRKTAIVKSMITNALGTSRKIFARKCLVREVAADEVFAFLQQNHLMSPIRRSGVGLYLGDELVSCIVVSRKRGVLKLERFASKIGCVVAGALSRLLAHVHEDDRVIESWVDLRYGDGHSLEKLGFVKVKETLGWKWTDGEKTYNRLRCRANMDKRGLSEKEHAEELGWYKIYDAGQRLYRRAAFRR